VSAEERVGAAADLPPGVVTGVGRYAVGNVAGRYFAERADRALRRAQQLG
jgi:hypothetical protein